MLLYNMSYAAAIKRAQQARSGSGGPGAMEAYPNYQMVAVVLSLSVMVQLLIMVV